MRVLLRVTDSLGIKVIIWLPLLFTAVSASLSGTWRNELNSTMTLKPCDGGLFSGWYTSGVGHAEGEYFLSGVCDSDGNSVAFAISWYNDDRNAHSATAWSGHLVGDSLYTTWTLSKGVSSAQDLWESTLVGTDIFRKQ